MSGEDPQRPQPLDYARPEKPRRRFWHPAILFTLLLLFAGLIVSVSLPSLNISRALSPRAMCQSNMHQIGLAILLYQQDYQQRYPDTLDQLMEEQLTAQVFICPESSDTASTGATTQAIAADFHKPGHLSYIYLGKGLDQTVSADTVVLYEPLSNHGGAGMNVLFGDGHVDWVTATVANKMLAAVATGVRPVKINENLGTVKTGP